MSVNCIIVALLCIMIAFAVGRIYEFYYAERNVYEQKYADYQQALLRKALQENRNKGYDFQAFFRNRNMKKIVVYGLGFWYEEFVRDIDESYFDVIYYADRNAEGISKVRGGYIYRPEELLNLDFDVVIVTSVVYSAEIRKQLEELGIQQEIWCYSEIVYNEAKEEML